MSQSVNLSDALVNDARATSEVAERSLSGQIEYWAQLGKAIEPLLSRDQALLLSKRGETLPLAQILQTVDSAEGRERLEKHLIQLPFPHYAAADQPGYLVRIEENGTKSTGKFVNGMFVPEEHESRQNQP